MRKKELIANLEDFDDASEVVFISCSSDLVDLESNGVEVNRALEVHNGNLRIIALME